MALRSPAENARRRSSATVVVLLAGAAAVTAGAALPAKAAPAAAPQVRILTPGDLSRPSAARLVVRIRVKGHGFRAYLNARDVTRRFRVVTGGRGKKLRRAVFRRGADLKVGENDMLATVERLGRLASDHSYFTLRLRRDHLLRVRSERSRAYRVPRLHVRTKYRVREARVWLNGKRVERQFESHDDLRGFSGRLAGDRRLRFGKNRVTVAVLQMNGLFARRTLTVRVPRSRPIASAGTDRRVSVGKEVSLNGRASRRALKPRGARRGPLRYRWRIVASPRGSKAKLLRATTPTPRLAPDTPGSYTARLVVTDRSGRSSADDVEIDAPQDAGPMGMPIQTITEQGGIQIADSDEPGAATYPRLGNWVQMLVLDPDTGTPMGGLWDRHAGIPGAQPGVLGFNQGQGAQLLAAVQQTQFQQLVLLTGQGQPVQLGSGDASSLAQAFKYLGGTLSYGGPTPNGTTDLDAGEWSLIGHQGLEAGEAVQNAFAKQSGIPGFLNGAAGRPGSLNGYLQSGAQAVGYQFVAPETVPIDTKWTPQLSQAPSATQNTISVGDQKYESDPIDGNQVPGCPCSIGIQVVVLDPGTLALIDHGTFGILTDDGSTAFAGIYFLDQKLNEYVNDHGPGRSALIILQDFGKQGCACWPASSPDWLQDSLPATSYTPDWRGYSISTQPGDLFHMWNRANVHGFGSVAGNLGKLAGIPVHDVVANYRRPVYYPGTDSVVPRTWGGLTVVAATNLYQWSSAYWHGQGDTPPASNDPLLNNGRVTGVLRRNQQSQWEMTSGTVGAGYPGLVEGSQPDSPVNAFDAGGLPELVLAPSAPWPCSTESPAPCPDDPGQIRAAMAYIASMLPDLGGISDVRDAYLNDNITWSDQHTDIPDSGIVKCDGHSDFTSETCDAMRSVLSQEFEDLDQVHRGFGNLADLFASDSRDAQFDIKGAAGDVTAAVLQAKKDLLRQEATMDIASPIEDALFVVSEVLDLALAAEVGPEALAFAPGALGATASLMELGGDVFPFFAHGSSTPGQRVANDTGLIRDQVHNLGNDLRIQLAGVQGTLKHFEDIVRTDPEKLHQAAVNFGLKWSLSTKNEMRLGQSVTIAANQALYRSLMPIAFNQWMVSPQTTDTNPAAAKELPDRSYRCRRIGSDGQTSGHDAPMANEPSRGSGMTSVGFSAVPGENFSAPRTGFTVRFLKAKDDDMQLRGAEIDSQRGDNYLQHKGDSPSAQLTDPLFEPPSDLVNPTSPTSLGMDKDEFFGMGTWYLRRLQCGWINGDPDT